MLKYINRGRDNSGFTLIESLLALFTSSFVLLLVTMTFQMLTKSENAISNGTNNIEWHIFLNQTEYDTQNKKLTKTLPYEIYFEEKETLDTITYTQNGTKIRWQRNKAGYVPVLNKVQQVKFINEESELLIDVTFTNGQNLKGRVPIVKE